MIKKGGQVGIEYLVIVGFVTFVIIGILGLAFYYINGINDEIRSNQIQKLGNNIVSTADVVYYAGEPSQKTIRGYIPKGVNSIQLINKDVVFNVSYSSGESIISFSSGANLTGSLDNNEGVRDFIIIAQADTVSINLK